MKRDGKQQIYMKQKPHLDSCFIVYSLNRTREEFPLVVLYVYPVEGSDLLPFLFFAKKKEVSYDTSFYMLNRVLV